MWSTLRFGKYKGKSFPQVLLIDPDWFFWAIDKRVFVGSSMESEAQDLLYKACNIKIPKSDPENWGVGYYFGDDGRLWDMQIVRLAEFKFGRFLGGMAKDRLNLRVVRMLRGYDKGGGKILLKRFKEYYFDGSNARITRSMAEQFFSEPENFVWPVHRSVLPGIGFERERRVVDFSDFT